MVLSLLALTGCGCTLYFTLYRDGDYTAVLSRLHCTSWPHAMNYPSFLALCYFLIEPIRLSLKHVQFVTHPENQLWNSSNKLVSLPAILRKQKKPDPRPFTPLLHSNNMVTVPGQQGCLFGMVFSIYEVFFVANICVVGLFTSFMLIIPCRNRQTSASREGNVNGSRSFHKKEVGKRGSSREVQLFSSIESV